MAQYPLGLKSLTDPKRGHFPRFKLDDATLARLPGEVDYTDYFPAAENQGQYGTCVGFGTGKVFEFFHAKRKGDKKQISKRALFGQIKTMFYPDDPTDDGAQVSDGLAVLEQQGYVYDQDWPYELAQDFSQVIEPFPPGLEHKDFEFKNFVEVPIDVPSLQGAIFRHGPVVLGVDWPNAWFNPDSQGRVQPYDYSAGGHCVPIVGYNNSFQNLDGSEGAFLISNSWGPAWGKNGYFYLPFNQTNHIQDAFTVAA